MLELLGQFVGVEANNFWDQVVAAAAEETVLVVAEGLHHEL